MSQRAIYIFCTSVPGAVFGGIFGTFISLFEDVFEGKERYGRNIVGGSLIGALGGPVIIPSVIMITILDEIKTKRI